MTKFLATLACTGSIVLAFSSVTFGQEVAAVDLLDQINEGKPVRVLKKTIRGDLDLTILKNKTPGGSYGVRGGKVKERFTKVKAPVTLEDCIIDGAIVTYREEKKGRTLIENFVAIDAPIVLRRCTVRGNVQWERLKLSRALILENCIFEQPVSFRKVKFEQLPVLKGNTFANGITKIETEFTKQQPKGKGHAEPRPMRNPGIPIVLKNPSLRSVPIQFGENKWNLSPGGTSTLHAPSGTKVYLLKSGKRDRVLLTVKPLLAGETIDVTRL